MAPRPAEYDVVEGWIDANTDRYHILQWFPPDDNPRGDGQLVRVQYRYHGQRTRGIETDRIFLVEGESVTILDPDEDG